MFIKWNLTTIFINFTLFFRPHSSQFWVGHEPHIIWHFIGPNSGAISLILSEFGETDLTKGVVVVYA